MANVTKSAIRDAIKAEHGEELVVDLDVFLNKHNASDKYYDTICSMYNDLGHYSVFDDIEDPLDRFESDMRCSGEYEIVSCFVDFDKAADGREFWENLSKEWQLLIDKK